MNVLFEDSTSLFYPTFIFKRNSLSDSQNIILQVFIQPNLVERIIHIYRQPNCRGPGLIDYPPCGKPFS